MKIFPFCCGGTSECRKEFYCHVYGRRAEYRHEIPGTTRDSVYTRYTKFGFDFFLVDTAGIRKKSKVEEDLEFYSVMRSIRAIENSDVCILMLDATRGIEGQDLNIVSVILRNQKGLVVAVNKWDLIEDQCHAMKKRGGDLFSSGALYRFPDNLHRPPKSSVF